MFLSVRGFIMRNRMTILNLSLLTAMLCVLGFICFEFDIFLKDGTATLKQRTIDLDEVLVMASALCIGLLLLCWQRVRQVKREMALRIASEQAY